MTRNSETKTDLPSHPLQGPLAAEAFFAERPPAQGVRPCRRLGLGTAYLGRFYDTPKQGQAVETIHAAWREGFALVDSAPGYGPAEPLLGEALRRWRGDRPIVATKTAQTETELAVVKTQYARSVERLGKIDLLAVHDARPRFSVDQRNAIADYVGKLQADGEIVATGLGGGGPDVQADWYDIGTFNYVITFFRLGALTLQGLTDAVPSAKHHGASVFAASPLFMGLLGSQQTQLLANPPRYFPPVFIKRARRVADLANEWDISLTHLALRFLLSMPMVDVVLTGAANPAEWADVQAAYEAGPLPADLYKHVWQLAQQDPEPRVGG